VQYYLENADLVEAEKWASKEMEFGSSVGMVYVAIALCEKERIGGLNMLMSLAQKGDERALNAFPVYVNKFLELGIDLTPEMIDFIKSTYSVGQVSQDSTCHQPLSKWNKIKAYLALAVLAVIAIWFLWVTVTPTVVVIEKDKKHRTENVLGSLKVLNPEGKEIELSDLNFFTRYIYNGTNSTLVCYNVLYSNDKAAANKFKEEYYLVVPNMAKAVDELPDFYFEEPESIEIEEHWLVSIFSGIFGKEEIRWVIDEYVSDNDMSSLTTETVLEIAESGNPLAQYHAGLRYLTGESLAADTLKAFEWVKKSAEQGCAEGEMGLALMYSYGLGTTENPVSAFEYMKRASGKNNAEAHWYLAMFYYNGYGVEKNLEKYRELIEFSARGGFVDGQTELALIYLDEGNADKANEWLDKAFEQTPNPVHISVAGFTLINMGGEERIEQGFRYLQYAAEHGEEDAIAALKEYPTLDSLKRFFKPLPTPPEPEKPNEIEVLEIVETDE
jgi:TPR repeat protein